MPDRATDDLAERLRVMSRDELATAIKAAIDQRDNRITALTARLAALEQATPPAEANALLTAGAVEIIRLRALKQAANERLERVAGEDVVEMAMKAYVVAWHAAPKGKQSQCGVEAVLSAIAPTLRGQEREACAVLAESACVGLAASGPDCGCGNGRVPVTAYRHACDQIAARIRAGGAGG